MCRARFSVTYPMDKVIGLIIRIRWIATLAWVLYFYFTFFLFLAVNLPIETHAYRYTARTIFKEYKYFFFMLNREKCL